MAKGKNRSILIFALAAHGQGLSGGDRIFIEFARRWNKKMPVIVYVWEEGYRMCLRYKLKIPNIKFQISSMYRWKKLGFLINYLARVIEGIRIGLTVKKDNTKHIIVYSASEFWMDSLPAFIIKLRYPEIIWAAAWYQTAPKPWIGFTEGEREKRYYFKSLIYWLIQQPIKLLISHFADFVLVNNEEEKKQFPKLKKLDRAIVVVGTVDLGNIKKWQKELGKLPKKYDAVFQGRFHPQKGVLELIDIWRMVVNERPKAKLILIGDGPLMKIMKPKIQNLKLERSIKLTGYLFDGRKKYKIFSQSKIVIHPSFYDSGGMAALEAMAFGLPAVGFDLKSFKAYYPKGMIKVKIGNLREFSKTIIDLLENKDRLRRIAKEALDLVKYNWSWDRKADEVLSKIISI